MFRLSVRTIDYGNKNSETDGLEATTKALKRSAKRKAASARHHNSQGLKEYDYDFIQYLDYSHRHRLATSKRRMITAKNCPRNSTDTNKSNSISVAASTVHSASPDASFYSTPSADFCTSTTPSVMAEA